jgi:hypothetical protein
MRTCLSSFSDFFKDLACVPHDTVKNVEETKPADLTEVKEDSKSESKPENTLVEKVAEGEVHDVDTVYEETPSTYRHSRTTALEACIILAPLILGALYSYVMTTLIYQK